MYAELEFKERQKVARAHARWSRAVMMAKSFALVCLGVAAVIYAI